jgi:hypothetical protein
MFMEKTLTLKGEAKTLRLFETMAKQLGIFVEVTKKTPVSSDIRKFDSMCKEARKFANNTGLKQNDISDAIKKVRSENANSY